MKINIKNLIEYFDLKESTKYGDATATISLAGEDLCAAIFKHYRENVSGKKIKIIDSNIEIPTTMKKKGRRLDRWIVEEGGPKHILYQTEIKNWCSRAIGGINIPINIKQIELDKLSDKNWNSTKKDIDAKLENYINKVFINMVSDKRIRFNNKYEKCPLLLFWDARKPIKSKSFFHKYKVPKKYFFYDYCMAFSCSLYLRSLLKERKRKIDLDMPNVERRMERMIQLFGVK